MDLKNENKAEQGEIFRYEEFRLISLCYDAQLKKMLAYIAAAISSLLLLSSIFLSVFGTQNLDRTSLPAAPALALAFLLWLAACILGIAMITKFQEIVIIERELGMARLYELIHPHRALFPTMWMRLFRKVPGFGGNLADRSKYNAMNPFINIVSIIFLSVVTFIFACILEKVLFSFDQALIDLTMLFWLLGTIIVLVLIWAVSDP